MTRQAVKLWLIVLAWALPTLAQGQDLEALQEKAMKAAMLKAAPSIVQIQTSGGLDVIGGGTVRKGEGPTTGVVVSADGYIISSAFNFANKPTEIIVSIPGQKDRLLAKVIANDDTRMLTLLKVDATGLVVPAAVPRKDIKIGQWSLALGRTWSGNQESAPSMSVGIISALDRIWGKAVQTDAKVSPVNYGGPIVDIAGRVQGVLVPASPRGEGETAGVEWYDSGIGFAIPLEDINAVLPRLKKGENLKRGVLGVNPQGGDIYEGQPTVASVATGSAADKAGIKAGDKILEIDGQKVVRQAQVMHILGKKYEGDTVVIKVQRDGKEETFNNVTLGGPEASHQHAFLGIVPMRDDQEPGVEVRFIYAKSPAEAAGLKAGDRILSVVGDTPMPKPNPKIPVKPPVGGAGLKRDAFIAAMNRFKPGDSVKVEYERGGKKDTATVKLAALPDSVPDKLPEPGTKKQALGKAGQAADAKKPETGLLKRKNAAMDHDYWVYVPDNYDPNVSHSLLVWLHPEGKGKDRDNETFIDTWKKACADQHMILLIPIAGNDTGWLRSEADVVKEAIRDVFGMYTIDKQRVVAHGMGVGGQLGYYLAFNNRDIIRGVATTGAPNPDDPKSNVANQRLAFFMVAGDKDPRAAAIRNSRTKLVESRYPVVFVDLPETGHQYLDAATLSQLVRWIDSLDRI